MKRTSITLLLVLMLMVAGCSSLGGNSASTSSKTSVSQTSTKAADSTASTSSADGGGSESTSTTTSEATQTTTTAAATTTTTTTTTTSADSWTKPKPPNTPLQNKMDENDGSRISNVEVIHKEEASDGGYSNFDVAFSANTSMKRVDPAEHGTVRGEPYFLVYANGDLDNGSRFTDTSGTLIERTPVVSQEKNGDFAIEIHPEALDKAGADGKVKLMILLMDRDSDWDDIYGVAWVTVDYSSSE
ncbi:MULTISPECIES: hypothetical protein [unclassified Haladaptatus]|uniref:hypothetical protein n=1 Tax=unclassified Haladaptatus TaxID=2622732 RepID=UPI00209C65E0|nr:MULTISPECIES: hypothetical protein [unclassified Haladaptatus]MCO8244385.1 hypothetical protein [Haladaptatus sp. AB643]MCO8253992.1 hypothetical protein [Haladaptatus sp. AB618]